MNHVVKKGSLGVDERAQSQNLLRELDYDPARARSLTNGRLGHHAIAPFNFDVPAEHAVEIDVVVVVKELYDVGIFLGFIVGVVKRIVSPPVAHDLLTIT
jgi:hypothetical protein